MMRSSAAENVGNIVFVLHLNGVGNSESTHSCSNITTWWTLICYFFVLLVKATWYIVNEDDGFEKIESWAMRNLATLSLPSQVVILVNLVSLATAKVGFIVHALLITEYDDPNNSDWTVASLEFLKQLFLQYWKDSGSEYKRCCCPVVP